MKFTPGHWRTRRDGDGKLAREDANIERETIVGEAVNIFDERLALRQFVGLGVKNSANAFQLGMAGDLRDVLAERGIFRARAGYDSFERIVGAIGEREDVAGFLEHERFIDVGFYVHAFFDFEPAGGGEIVGHAEGSIQCGKRLQPGVRESLGIPEMLMRVDDFHFRRRAPEAG